MVHFLGQAHEIAAVLVGAIAVEMQQMGDLRSDFGPVESIRRPQGSRGNTLRRAIGFNWFCFCFGVVHGLVANVHL